MLAQALALAAVVLAAPPRPIVIKAARLYDGRSPTLTSPGVIVVEGTKIQSVGRGATPPAGADVIDLGDVTLLPGFIDAHTHMIGRTLGDPMGDYASVRDFESYGAILGVENARKTLMAGFTSIRVVGSGNFDDMALRQAI